MIVMPKHTIIAPRTFRDLLQFTPFIYPPTPFGSGRRQHMILVGNYFPTNYSACQKFLTPPLPYKKFPKWHRKRGLGGIDPRFHPHTTMCLIGYPYSILRAYKPYSKRL